MHKIAHIQAFTQSKSGFSRSRIFSSIFIECGWRPAAPCTHKQHFFPQAEAAKNGSGHILPPDEAVQPAGAFAHFANKNWGRAKVGLVS